MIDTIDTQELNPKKKKLIEGNYRIGIEKVDSLCNISVKHKYLYMVTPKVGCSTIKRNLHILENDGVDAPFAKIHKKLESPLYSPLDSEVNFQIALANYYKFSFVRNPYTRVLSCFLSKFRERENPKFNKFKEELGFDQKVVVTFEEFLERVSEQEPKEMNNHWMPVSFILSAESVRYDFIGRFERFEDDLKTVMRRIVGENGLSLPKNILYIRRHPAFRSHAGEKLWLCMSRRAQHLVQKIYAEDFEQFGYEKDIGKAFVMPTYKRLWLHLRSFSGVCLSGSQ